MLIRSIWCTRAIHRWQQHVLQHSIELCNNNDKASFFIASGYSSIHIHWQESSKKKIKVACQLLCHKSRWHVTNCAKCLFLSPPPPLLEVHFSLMNSVFAALPLCGIWTMKQALEDIFIIMLKSSSIILYGCLPSSVPLWLNSCLIGIFIHWTELTSFSSKMSK